MIKKTIIFLLLLCAPQFSFAYYVCHPCCGPRRLPGWWTSADYLFLWRKHRYYPPLVTTNPAGFPALTQPGTEILFGDAFANGAPKSGGRFDIGLWLTRCLGFGGGFFVLAEDKIKYEIEGNGFPILGRPFFNVSTGAQDASLISFPLLVGPGRLEIEAKNFLRGFDLYTRYRFLDSCCFKFDLLAGYLYNRLGDNLDIETHTTFTPLIGLPTRRFLDDRFHCRNDFYAGLVGLMSEWRSCNWAVTVTGKVGIGNMVQKVHISGLTRDETGGIVTTVHSGLLAQPSNIGIHSSNKFEIIPQINANLQLRLIGHLWLTAGYTYMFWPAVLLAGEQVNLNVNPTQVPGPPVGPIEPKFSKVDRSFWVHGLTAGFYIFY